MAQKDVIVLDVKPNVFNMIWTETIGDFENEKAIKFKDFNKQLSAFIKMKLNEGYKLKSSISYNFYEGARGFQYIFYKED